MKPTTAPIREFFDDLAPKLEQAGKEKQERDVREAPCFNTFDHLRTDEIGLSRVIGGLLDPRGADGQGPLFLKTLIEGLEETGFNAGERTQKRLPCLARRSALTSPAPAASVPARSGGFR